MKLEDCVGKRGINASKLAELIGYSRTHIQMVITGKLPAGKKLVKALQNVSEEEVMKIHHTETSYKNNDC